MANARFDLPVDAHGFDVPWVQNCFLEFSVQASVGVTSSPNTVTQESADYTDDETCYRITSFDVNIRTKPKCATLSELE